LPKIVNRGDRRAEVCGAAMRILARGGPRALSLRSLAAELNGSITLVTHFFTNRDDLFEAITDDLLNTYDDDSDWRVPDDPVASLRGLISWLVPANEEDAGREASRLALISMREQSPSIDRFYVVNEQRVRGLLADALSDVAPAQFVETGVDTLRSAVNGLMLSIVEHPDHWTTERRQTVIDVIHSGVLAAARAYADDLAVVRH
jgi:AcrR family transcriptional regulator